MTGEVYYCGTEEHQHDEECYLWVLMSDEKDDESAMTAADEDAEEIASTTVSEETVQNSELGAAEEAAQDSEIEATEETVQGSAEETEEGTIQISETDSEEEASQSLETEEETDTSDNTISSDSNSEAASVTSIEEGTEPETSKGNDASDNKTDALPAMILLSEATETEEWYFNHDYEKVLICNKEEHTHTAKCLMDETADVETAEDWEATLPENLNGTAAENLVAVALSQLGYSESEQNFSLSEDGETKNGYTRYGAWYGNTYGEWDAMFVAFCLHYAGISEDDFPVNSGAYAWAVQLAEADLYAAVDDYTPNAGDLIFLDTDEDGKADQVGIVECVTEGALTVSSGESGTEASDAELSSDIITQESLANESEITVYTLTVILGDYCDGSASDAEETTADAVCRVEFSSDDAAILGYGVLPDVEVNPPVNSAGETVDSALEEQTLSVTVDDLTVTLSGQLPVDATVSAEPVDLELEGQEVQFALEISIYDADGNEFEPEDDTITVTVESESITEGCTIYYVPDEGDLEEMASETENGSVSFDAEHFSVYAGLSASSGEMSLYDVYMETIAEYEEQAYALADGDDASAVALTSDLGDLLDAVYEDYEAGKLTEEEYNEIVNAINTIWDWLEENFDLYGTSYTAEQGTYNSWTIIGEDTKVISSNNRLNLSMSDAMVHSGVSDYNTVGYLAIEKDGDKNKGNHGQIVVRMDSSYMKDSSLFEFPENSYVLFKNAGTIDGKEIDVKITFISIQFQNYDSRTSAANSNGYGGYLRLAYWNDWDDSDEEFFMGMGADYHEGDTRWYPVETVTTIQVDIIYHDSENGSVTSNFLVCASDLDICSTRGSVTWHEGFATVSGFNGMYYRYAASADYLSITETKLGSVSVYAKVENLLLTGDNSYKLAGIYAETSGSSWKQQHINSAIAGSLLEIYIPYYDVTIQKVSAENESTTISGATFVLYKIESEKKYYYVSKDSWVEEDKDSATQLITNGDGVLTISELYPNTYYLEEVTPPEGYALLSSPVQFTLSLGGTVTIADDSKSVAELDSSDSLKLIIENEPEYELPSTGDSGTILYTSTGLTLLFSAAWLMYKQKRRRKERIRGG